MSEIDSDVTDMIYQMQKFSWIDYVVFVLMLAISAFVGVYWGFFKKQNTQNDYLLGGRNMKVVPVSMSLVASFVSGITLLGSPTEVYMHGTQYAYIMGGIFLMSIIMTQYLSMRFDNRVRLFGSILFAFTLIGWLPIVIYVPALAFNQVTGVDIHVITPIVCLVCIFYTSAGGLQAVVWTDVIQITSMVGAMALVAVKGTMDVGGVGVVWKRNMESGRIEAPNWDPLPTARHTIWNLVIGGFIYWLQANAVNQTMVQRYLALPTLRGAKCDITELDNQIQDDVFHQSIIHVILWVVAYVCGLATHEYIKRAVILFCIGISILYCFCLYCGLLIYARFHDCDPLQTKLAKAKDQLLPLLVMDVLGDFPGLPGVFIAGIFSAALSSLSTSLNSMSAVVLEDFYKPFFKHRLSERQTNLLLKSVVVLLGTICVGLVFVVEKMGTILQLTMTLEAMTMGPQLGVFSMGILMPWIDATAALVGGTMGLACMAWWCLSAQLAVARGLIPVSHKPLTVDGCAYNYTVVEINTINETVEINPILHVSYMWYTLAGALITVMVGVIARRVSRMSGTTHVPPAPRLLAPFVRRMYREPPHPTDEPFIHAYGDETQQHLNSTSINMKPITDAGCEKRS